MLLALEEAPFVLQGPKPPIPPSAWEAYGLLGLVALGLLVLAVFAIRRFLRQGRVGPAPHAQLEIALRLAETQPPADAIAQATRAFRGYLAALEPRAAVSLSTEELVPILAGLPVFLPARQPLLAALRSADAAKFAGAALEVPLLIAGLREAAKRVEDARRTFARPVVAPVVAPIVPPKARPASPAAPPLPGPPPLPGKERA
jgi:hypothetical protein